MCLHHDSDEKESRVLWRGWHLSWTLRGEREGISDQESRTEVGISTGFAEETSVTRTVGVRQSGGPGSRRALRAQKRAPFPTLASRQRHTVPEGRKYQRRRAAF